MPCPHTRTVPCPMPGSGEYNKDNVIYQATVTSGADIETCVGCTVNFADRYYKRRTDILNPNYKTSTTLSRYVWKLKEEKRAFSIKWKIIDRGAPLTLSARCVGSMPRSPITSFTGGTWLPSTEDPKSSTIVSINTLDCS